MPSSKQGQASITIRCTAEEHEKAQKQADAMGLTLSEYIRLIINLDASTGIIIKLRG
jgi:antitoxin component of RelBE/YafQ-DinJ toxin-antitoxin module